MENKFDPNFDDPFNVRFNLFKSELEFIADHEFKDYFDGRADAIDLLKYSHRLWHYIMPDLSSNGGKPVAIVYLKKDAELPDAMVDRIEEAFAKHFRVNERNPIMRTIFV